MRTFSVLFLTRGLPPSCLDIFYLFVFQTSMRFSGKISEHFIREIQPLLELIVINLVS